MGRGQDHPPCEVTEFAPFFAAPKNCSRIHENWQCAVRGEARQHNGTQKQEKPMAADGSPAGLQRTGSQRDQVWRLGELPPTKTCRSRNLTANHVGHRPILGLLGVDKKQGSSEGLNDRPLIGVLSQVSPGPRGKPRGRKVKPRFAP